MEQGAPIVWEHVARHRRSGSLLEFLKKLPRERWTECDSANQSFLHHAAESWDPTALALLLRSKLIDVNATSVWGGTPVECAVVYECTRALELLCAAGADLRLPSRPDCSPLDVALAYRSSKAKVIDVLIANGVRLSTVCYSNQRRITPRIRAFERGVLRCRAAVAALLSSDRIGRLSLREVAIAVWATRYSTEWQN